MKLFKSFTAIVAASLFTAGLLLAAETAPSKVAPCCAKAKADGKTCTHACCVEAAKTGMNCTKCKGSGKIETKADAKK